MRRMTCVLDAQFGSTGKGNVVGWLGQKEQPDVLVTAWAPNAGHTSVVNGVKLIHTQLANGIQSPNLRYVLLGPGSVINLPYLINEVHQANLLTGCKFEMVVHPKAAILMDGDADAEAAHLYKIGSTMKGSMAALVRKLSRTSGCGVISQAIESDTNTAIQWDELAELMENVGGTLTCDEDLYHTILEECDTALLEGCQGFGLGINSGIYPYTTSRECTYAQMMVDMAIPRQLIEDAEVRVIGVARTFPIRVANRYDEDGNQIGTSGPGWGDQKELTWDEVGQPPELTTVTLLERRVFEFSVEQVAEAARVSGFTEIFMTFADYVNDRQLIGLVAAVADATDGRVHVSHCAFGPKDTDIQPWPQL